MKKVMNMVKKRQSQSSGDDRSTGGTSRLSLASGATSPVLQCQRSHPSSPSLKYNYFTDNGKDKSLSKLHIAVWKEDVEKVRKYVKKGFENQDSVSSTTAGSGSEKTPSKKLKRFLAGKEENQVNSRDRYARTPLHLCASNGNESILWQLLSHGADVHAKDCDGATPLHRAIDACHDDTARMILDRGCSLDVADVDGDTALHVAVRRQNNEVLAVLLRKGANPDLRNGLGDCPLHEAIKQELIPTAQLLLRGGSEVNIQGANGQTPLMIASSNENMTVLVDTLLNYEADPFILNKDGKSAVDLAANQDILDILNKFIDESRQRTEFSKSDNHSFDDDIIEENEVVQHHNQEDLTSWESSAAEEDYKAGNAESKLKHSPGLVDLSKFLTPSDDEIYDTVENVGKHPDHYEEHHHPESDDDWDDEDSLPLSDAGDRKLPSLLPSEAKVDPEEASSKASFKKRWSSRKSRSLRSTHLQMMSRPLVRSEHNSHQGSSSSSNKSSLSDVRKRMKKDPDLKKPAVIEAMKHEFLSKLQRQNASIIKSSIDDYDEENPDVPDDMMTILDPELLSMEKVDLLVHLQKIKLELDQIKKTHLEHTGPNRQKTPKKNSTKAFFFEEIDIEN